MKIIILLFSFYMLALPVIAQRVDACVDTEVCVEAADECLPGDCSDEKSNDCGSFCACSCCVHIVTVQIQSPQFIISKCQAKTEPGTLYANITLPSNYFGNIWQPPRISS